jgi:hypothetical protein
MRVILWTALAAASVLPTVAQVAPQPNPSHLSSPSSFEEMTTQAFSAEPAIPAVIFATSMPFREEPVKDRPFSATETTAREQILADGTKITSSVEIQVWRDRDGRKRAEGTLKKQFNSSQLRKTVSVSNPVDRTTMNWITGSTNGGRVTVMHLPGLSSDTPKPAMKGGLSALLSAPPPPPSLLTGLSGVVRSPKSIPDSSKTSVHTEQLPPDNIDGLNVEGIRTTTIIPSGSQGNDREITVVSETWTSPDLKIIVRQITDDPRTGKVTRELSHIDRADPDPALFQAPAGYTIKDFPDITSSTPTEAKH